MFDRSGVAAENATEFSGNVTFDSVIRSSNQRSNEPFWTESDFEDHMKRCKKDWWVEDQEELMKSSKMLHVERVVKEHGQKL